ncbi:MAG: class III extradiol ring-cleavage dioxygenase [Alphaproteobacteria bacterium]
MTDTSLPAIFLSHGSPGLILEEAPARDFLSGLGRTLGRPKAILCASAHWETDEPALNRTEKPETIHDFFGFPRPLYEIRYAAPGAPDVAETAARLLRTADLAARLDPGHGLDHGAWAPLYLMYPDATIPVAQISVQTHRGPDHHIAVGRALQPLRKEGVLILASGAATHNLRDFGRYALNAPAVAYASAFDTWLKDSIENGRVDELADYRRRAPDAARNHPSDEHFLPLFVALGAGSAKGRQIHASFTYGVLSMAAYAFD